VGWLLCSGVTEPRLARLLLRFFQRPRQRLIGPGVESGAGVSDAEPPAFGIVRLAVSPGHGDAALVSEFHGIQYEILRDTADLHLIALDRKALGTAAVQEQTALLCHGAYSLAQLLQQRGDIDEPHVALFAACLQSRQIGDVVEQMMQ